MEAEPSEWVFPCYTGGEKKNDRIHTRLEEKEQGGGDAAPASFFQGSLLGEEGHTNSPVDDTLDDALEEDPSRQSEKDLIWAYEAHYAACHQHQCRSCGKAFSSSRLLSIHLLERHDSFFLARAARGESVFECLADDCDEKFSTKRARRRHLVREHAYPRDFYLPGIEEKRETTKTTAAQVVGATPMLSEEKRETTKTTAAQVVVGATAMLSEGNDKGAKPRGGNNTKEDDDGMGENQSPESSCNL